MSLHEAALERGAGPIGGAARSNSGTHAPRAAALEEDGWIGRLHRTLDAERGRWFLWLPVFFGCGISLYFAAYSEPPAVLALAGVVLAMGLRLFLRGTALRLIGSSVVLALAFGFAAAKLQTLLVSAPVLQKELRYVPVEGWVEHVEPKGSRNRLTLRVIAIDRLEGQAMPRRVRVSVGGRNPGPAAGSAVRLRATLMPPPEPALPGGFDFARYYWFKGIGASGYVMGKVLPMAEPPPLPWDLRLTAGLGNLRRAIAGRVGAVLDGDRAAVAKALIMGERGSLSEEARDALRDAGLAHVIAISGFHMALTAGALFWLIRAALALMPWIALRYPIKAWAAVGALAIASLYLAISGMAVSALRAYLMVTIIFVAVILNRPAISLRNLAIAALVILALMPQSLLDAGFQMSFAATAALIAFYEVRPSLRPFEGWPLLIGLPLTFLMDIATTTMLASVAVDPFAAYHFHRLALYSMLANVLAMPVVGFLVMPMVMLTLIAMPFGLEAAPLQAMDVGIGWLLAVAEMTAGLPGAAPAVPRFAEGALTLMVAGGLWLIIWRGRWRFFGLAAIAAGLAIAPFGERADVWVDRDGKLVAIRDADGLIATPDTRKSSFSLERWMEADGDGRPAKQARGSKAFQCDGFSCVVLVQGRLVSHIYHPSALQEDCRRATILIARLPVPESCTGPEIVIDSPGLKQQGAQMIAFSSSGISRSTVAEQRGIRPWVVRHRRREKIPVVAPRKAAAN